MRIPDDANWADANEDVGTQGQPTDLSPATVKRIYETTYTREMKESQARREWHTAGVAFLKDVQNASAQELASPDFTKRFWKNGKKDNRVSSAPDWINMKGVVENRELAEWIGNTAKTSLPPRGSDRISALEKIYGELCDRVKPLAAQMPWARILRVMAALFPEDYCFVVTVDKLRKVGKAMFGKLPKEEEESPSRLNARILGRLTEILGPTDGTLEQLAVRSQFVWTLWKTVGDQAGEGPPKQPKTDSAPTPDSGTNIQPKPPEFILPPIPNAESLLARIRQVQGMPERNMEDVVKAFLLQLGHAESAVAFQVGHVDVRVNDEQGMGRIVVEVKRTLLNETTRRDAVRKGFDYAMRVGAPLVVITDADTYEVYDRKRGGMNYDMMLCGRFQLTRFNHADETVLDLLRPATWTNT